jgi:pyridoxal phosphate enzyme (YggS family)
MLIVIAWCSTRSRIAVAMMRSEHRRDKGPLDVTSLLGSPPLPRDRNAGGADSCRSAPGTVRTTGLSRDFWRRKGPLDREAEPIQARADRPRRPRCPKDNQGRVLESGKAAMSQEIRANLDRVLERIAGAAARSGRRRGDVLLIGVSKTVDVARIREAIDAGVPALGENRVQEAKAKIAEIGRPVPWHLIGHLQSNKAKDAVELFDVIHSIDDVTLARECDRRARAHGRVVDVLVEVNVASEASKSGLAAETLGEVLEAMATLDHIRVRGLMTIPPIGEPEESRPWFRSLRKLAERHGLRELSMGMSNDFEVAVEEGATMVRVGTAIFGPRPLRP